MLCINFYFLLYFGVIPTNEFYEETGDTVWFSLEWNDSYLPAASNKLFDMFNGHVFLLSFKTNGLSLSFLLLFFIFDINLR